MSIAPGFKLSFPFAHKRPQNAVTANEVCARDDDRPLTQPFPGDKRVSWVEL